MPKCQHALNQQVQVDWEVVHSWWLDTIPYWNGWYIVQCLIVHNSSDVVSMPNEGQRINCSDLHFISNLYFLNFLSLIHVVGNIQILCCLHHNLSDVSRFRGHNCFQGLCSLSLLFSLLHPNYFILIIIFYSCSKLLFSSLNNLWIESIIFSYNCILKNVYTLF